MDISDIGERHRDGKTEPTGAACRRPRHARAAGTGRAGVGLLVLLCLALSAGAVVWAATVARAAAAAPRTTRRATGLLRVSLERRPDQLWVRISGQSPLPRHYLRATGRGGDLLLTLPGRAGRVGAMPVGVGGIRRVVTSSQRGQLAVRVERDAMAGFRSAYTPNRRELVLEVDMVAAKPVAKAKPAAPAAAEDPLVPLPPSPAAGVVPAPPTEGAAVTVAETSAPPAAGQPKRQAAASVQSGQPRLTAEAPRAKGAPVLDAAVPRLVSALPGTWRVLGAQEGAEKLVTLDFVNADIQDVLKALAIQSGTNILVAPKVEGKVTVALRNVSPEQALEYVVRLAGLAYGREDGTYVVCPRDQIDDLFPAGTRGRVLFPPPVPGPAAPTAATGRTVATVRLQKLAAADVVPVTQKLVPGLEVQAPDPALVVLIGTAEQVTAAQGAIQALEAAAPNSSERGREVPAGSQAPALDDAPLLMETYSLRHVSAADAGRILDGLMKSGGLPRVVVTPAPAPAYPVGQSTTSQSKTTRQMVGDPSEAFLALLYGPGNAAAGAGAKEGSASDATTAAGSTVAIPAGTEANTLLLIGKSKSDIDQVRQMLETMDVAPKQVMIDLKVTDVSLSDEQRLGVSWSWGNFDLKELGPGGAVGGGEGSDVVVPEMQLGRFGHVPVNFNATLEALLKNQKARLLANPRVAVLDGKTASIHVGDTVRYLEQRTSGIGGTSVTIGSVDVGVVVEVTPRMGGDDVIVLDVRPQVNVIVGFTDTGDGGQVPNTSERSIQTVVRLRDGETLAIGGLIREEDMETMSKIPGLGDLPLVGQLFRFKNKQRRNSEVLIFITPTLVSDQP